MTVKHGTVAIDVSRKFTEVRDRMVVSTLKGPDVKDNLGMMSKSNYAAREICEVISILQAYPHESVHSQVHYKLNVREADYKIL